MVSACKPVWVTQNWRWVQNQNRQKKVFTIALTYKIHSHEHDYYSFSYYYMPVHNISTVTLFFQFAVVNWALSFLADKFLPGTKFPKTAIVQLSV